MLEALPLDRSTTSSLVKSEKPVNYEAEREMLWKLVLGMKSEIAELRESIKGDSAAGRKQPTTSLIKYPG